MSKVKRRATGAAKGAAEMLLLAAYGPVMLAAMTTPWFILAELDRWLYLLLGGWGVVGIAVYELFAWINRRWL